MTEKWQALQRGGALLTISKQSGHILVHQFSHKGLKCFCYPFYLNSYCCLSY